MTVEVTIIDMKLKQIILKVDKSITIGELRKLFVEKGGNGGYDQWKYDGEILKNDNQRLQDVKGFDEEGMAISVTTNVRGGGGAEEFCDVSKNNYSNHTLTSDGPSYRSTLPGINIYGDCTGNGCIAHGKEVIVPIEKDSFDLIKEKYNLKCPECHNVVKPKTIGFRLCEYRITGKKIDKDKIVPFSYEDRADKSGTIKYYDPNENGIVIMVELKFEVIKYL